MARGNFELSQAVEKVFMSQFVTDIATVYLAALHNATTSQYGDSILCLLHHLLKTNGCITPQIIKLKEIEICKMQYGMVHSVKTMFNICILAVMPMSETSI